MQPYFCESHEREKRWMTEQETNRKNMAAYEKQLEQLEEKLDELAEIRLELEERKEHFASGNKKYELLLKTMDKLQQAKDTLTARYIEPVQKGFTKYYQMVDGGDAKEAQLVGGDQLDFFGNYAAHQQQKAELERELSGQQAIVALRQKYGKNAVFRGMDLQEGATTKDRNGQIGGHKA